MSVPTTALVITPTTLPSITPDLLGLSPSHRRWSWRHLNTLSLSLLGSRGPKVPLLWLVLAAAGWLTYVTWQRHYLRLQHRQHQRNLELYWSKFHSSIRFGFDIGGTLCKLVYFEPDVVSDEQAEVKQRVDAFIKGSTTYGETGNRDSVLQFSCRQIHGTFHFLKFQTSMMANFIQIVRQHNLSPLLHSPAPLAAAAAESAEPAAKQRSRSMSGRRHSTGKLLSPALVSSSAAVLSFSTAQSTSSSAAQTTMAVTSPPTNGAATPNARNGRPKLGATAWYTLTDPASPPLLPLASTSSSSDKLSLADESAGDALSTTSSHAVQSTPSASIAYAPFSLKGLNGTNPSPPFSQSVLHNGERQQTQSAAAAPPPPQPAPSDTATSASTASDSSASSSSSAPSTSSSASSTSPPDASSTALLAPSHPPLVCGTGGGAYKFASVFRSSLSIELEIMDELESLVRGIDFMIHTVPDECYYLSQFLFKLPLQRQTHPPVSYPYLVCNIGSGVSILKVSGPHQFERVGGTSLGGGTFLGLCRALTGCDSFEEALLLAERGHSSAVDLLVGDIYGGDYEQLGLAKENVAASFGKLVRSSGDAAVRDVRREDLAKAALVMITNNISSLVNLYAHQVLHVPQMIFVGNFLTHNEIAKRGLAFATDYWSQQTAKALFLRHEGYFGAVGSLLA